MSQITSRIRTMAQSLRGGTAIGVISNVWLAVFLARGIEPIEHRADAIARLSLTYLLLLSAVVAIGLYVYAALLNNVMDSRRDRLLASAGQSRTQETQRSMQTATAFFFLIMALAAGMLLGTATLCVCLLCAVSVLFYDTFGKYLPAVGIVSLALIRALIMFVPNPNMGYAWPVFFVMAHTTVCMAIGWHLVGKRPTLVGLERWMLAAGWAFWTMALIGWMTYHKTMRLPVDVMPPFGSVGVWLIPVLAGMALLVVARRTLIIAADQTPREARQLGEQFVRRSFTWLILYDIGWLLGLGMFKAAAVHVVLLMLAALINTWTYSPQAIGKPAMQYGLSDPA